MQCPACGYIKNKNSHKCDNCGLIFNKFSPHFEPEKVSMIKKIFKFTLKFAVITTLIFTLWVYVSYKYRTRYFNSMMNVRKSSGTHLVIAPIGSDMKGLDFVYVSGIVSLKNDMANLEPIKRAVLSFESEDNSQKREILTHINGFYEISLKQDIYFLTVYIPETKKTFKEKLDLRNIEELKNKDIIFN